jgi:molybdopterin molybdotransferase
VIAMLDFFQARRQIVEAASALGKEQVALSEACGRVLAENLVASAPLPPFDYSAMDGYALRSTDVNGRARWELPVAGECRAGDPPARVPPNQAQRLFTGAPITEGADSVVIQENVERDGNSIRGNQGVPALANVRRSGEDLPAGTVALECGTRLGPFQLGLIAALDRPQVSVSRRPRVVVLSTGNELRAPGSSGRAGAIPESNSPVIVALAAMAGAQVTLAPSLPDDRARAAATFRALLAEYDVLVTIGGVSVGDHDVVRPALADAGVEQTFWKVAIRPGKPLVFGRAGNTFALGLPGNPASAQVTFALFGVPLIRALQADSKPFPEMTRVRLASPFEHKPGRLGIYRARLANGGATVAQNQASGSALSLAQADALVFVPGEVELHAADSELDAIRLTEL